MFESLTDRLQTVFRNLGRRGKLREADVDQALREIRLALLEADVNYQVAKQLVAEVRERALGSEVSQALNPAQQVVRIMHETLVKTLGEPARLILRGEKPRAIMLVGLQGSGKTTTAAKLGLWLQNQGDRVWMVAADPYRPAAAEQLQVLGDEINAPVFSSTVHTPADLCKAGMNAAAKAGASVVILDTAGRSQLDHTLMEELRSIRDRVSPDEILLVADAMTGQESVNIAQGFQEPLGLTGLILTKMDGDARGGAAISMRAVTGVPIKFIGTGEGRDALEFFRPDRMASRILGMGDLLTLIEKAESAAELNTAQTQISRISRGEFTLEDFAHQLDQATKMGPLGKIMELMPSNLMPQKTALDTSTAEKKLKRYRAILSSMTPYERNRPEVLNARRKRRIAAGSGTTVQEVNQLIRQYRQLQRIFKQVGKHAGRRSLGRLPIDFR